MTQGNEWATEGWASSGGGDRWKMSDNVGKLVRLRMKSERTMPGPRGDWQAIITDVDVIDDDGKGYTTMSDVAIGNAWVLGTFSDHLPYSAIGVVESQTYEATKTTGYVLRPATDEESAKAINALNAPGF